MKMRAHQMLKKKESGFTLVEVMIVIAVFGIMSAIAIPSFMSLLPGMRLNGSARGVFVALNQARMGAVAKNTVGNIRFTSATTYQAWLDDAPSSALFWYDPNLNDTLIKDGTTETGVTIDYSAIPYGTLSYNSRGLPAGTNTAGYNITLTNTENGAVKTVVVSALGIVTIP